MIINPYAFGGSPTDPSFANVVSLLHFDGADTSTTFTDVTGKTWTANGSAQLDTTNKVFGTASGEFGGVGDYISTPDHADWDFGSGPFTLEFRVRFSTTLSLAGIVSKPVVASYSPWLVFRNGTDLTFLSSSNGTSWDLANGMVIASGITTAVWYAIRITRDASNFYTFFDGTLVTTLAVSGALYDGTDSVLIATYLPGSFAHVGYVDEFRATKGVCRSTATYTLDASAFPDS